MKAGKRTERAAQRLHLLDGHPKNCELIKFWVVGVEGGNHGGQLHDIVIHLVPAALFNLAVALLAVAIAVGRHGTYVTPGGHLGWIQIGEFGGQLVGEILSAVESNFLLRFSALNLVRPSFMLLGAKLARWHRLRDSDRDSRARHHHKDLRTPDALALNAVPAQSSIAQTTQAAGTKRKHAPLLCAT